MNAVDRFYAHRCPVQARFSKNPEITAVLAYYPEEFVQPLSEKIEASLAGLEARFAEFVTKSSASDRGGGR